MGMIGDLTQLMFGISDRRKGKAFEAEAGERPDYTIPESVDKMIGMYERMSQTGLPGEDLMREDIQASTARTAGTAAQLADSPVAALTALGGAQQRELSAMRDLQMRAAQYQSQMQQNYAQAVGMRAGYEQEQWRQNQLLPWEIQMNRAMQLQTSGAGNIMGGISGAEDSMNEAGAAAMQLAMGMPPTALGGGGGQQTQGNPYMQNPYQSNAFVGPPSFNYNTMPVEQPWDYRNQPYK